MRMVSAARAARQDEAETLAILCFHEACVVELGEFIPAGACSSPLPCACGDLARLGCSSSVARNIFFFVFQIATYEIPISGEWLSN